MTSPRVNHPLDVLGKGLFCGETGVLEGERSACVARICTFTMIQPHKRFTPANRGS